MSDVVIGKVFDRDGKAAFTLRAPDSRETKADADIRRHGVGLIRALRQRYPHESDASLLERIKTLLTSPNML